MDKAKVAHEFRTLNKEARDSTKFNAGWYDKILYLISEWYGRESEFYITASRRNLKPDDAAKFAWKCLECMNHSKYKANTQPTYKRFSLKNLERIAKEYPETYKFAIKAAMVILAIAIAAFWPGLTKRSIIDWLQGVKWW